MANALENITAEIDRVVNSPYLVCLKTLHSLLVKCGSVVIHQWAVNCPHQIQRLALEVVEALQLWPYVVDMIELLSVAAPIRDEMFRASPTLLNYFIGKATSSPSGLEKYTSVCVNLLSEPLPSIFPLPASAQVLLHQLFEKAVIQPTAESVRPVHMLLRGACAELPSILPQETLNNFQNRLEQMMKTVKTIEEQSLSLYCLAVMAQLTQPQAAERIEKPVFEARKRAPVEATLVWFVGAKAPKTIHLLLLQVLFACSNDKSNLKETAFTRVQLAREALAAVQGNKLSDWVQANSPLVRKLHEKLLLTDLPTNLHLEMFAFAVMLSPSFPLAPSALLLLQQLLLRSDCPSNTTRGVEEQFTVIISSLLQYTDEEFWHDLIIKVINTVRVSGSVSSHEGCLKTLIVVLRTTLRCHAEFRGILHRLLHPPAVDGGVPEALGGWVKSTETLGLSNQNLVRGNASHLHSQQSLRFQFAILLLEAELCASTDGGEIDSLLMLDLLARVTMDQPQSDNSNSKKIAKHLSIVEELCTPEDEGVSHHWREKLAMELGGRQELVTQLVGQICRDFESRCQNVEQPLRREQLKFEKLEKDYDSLDRRFHDLEELLLTQQRRSEILSKEKDILQAELVLALKDIETVTSQKDNIEHTLERMKDDAARVLAATRHEFENQRLEMRTTIACNAESLDDQESEIRSLKQEIDKINDISKKNLAQALRERVTLEDSLREVQSRLFSQQEENIRKDQELARLLAREDSLVREVGTLQHDLTDMSEKGERLIRGHDDARATWEQESRHVRGQFETRINDVNSEWSRARHDLENVVTARESEITNLRESSLKELDIKENIIQDLQRKLHKYAKDLESKTSKLEESQKLRARLLTVMGLGNNETALPAAFGMFQDDEHQTSKSVKHRSGRPSMLAADIQEDLHNYPLTNSDGEASAASSSSSLASKAGHSPKRAKIRSLHTSFKIPTMHQPDIGPGRLIRAHRKRPSVGREPLADASNNVQNKKANPRRKSGFTRASTVPLTQAVVADHYMSDDEPMSTIPEDFKNSRHTSSVKGGNCDTWRGTHSTGASDLAGLNTADFDSTTVDLENFE